MSTMIHPTATVDPGAELGRDVSIGPGCIVMAGARIGDGCRLESLVRVNGNTTIGPSAVIKHGASLGGDPQSMRYGGWPTYLEIGPDAWIGEHVTIHRGSEEGGFTKVGARCYFMAYSHVGHDCKIDDDVVLTNYAGLAGHVVVEDHALIAAYGGLHQFCRVGRYAMVGAHSGLNKDVVPYVIVQGAPASPRSLNLIGLRRAGFSEQTLMQLKRLFKIFFRSDLDTTKAVETAEAELDQTPEVRHFIGFVLASERGIAK